MIRAYTRSDYDHAAMVLKFGSSPDEVYFIEAVTNGGVCIKQYSQMKQSIGSFYNKIVTRHVQWDRPDLALETCNRFVKEAVGRKYNMSVDFFRNR